MENVKDLEKINNLVIAIKILYIKEQEICPAYVSKINSNCKKEIIILSILNVKKKAGFILQ